MAGSLKQVIQAQIVSEQASNNFTEKIKRFLITLRGSLNHIKRGVSSERKKVKSLFSYFFHFSDQPHLPPLHRDPVINHYRYKDYPMPGLIIIIIFSLSL